MRAYKSLRGFTIIEILIVSSLIILLLSFEFININKYNEKLNSYDTDYSLTSILQMLNESRIYCREKKIAGILYFDVSSNIIRLYCNNKTVQFYNLSSKTKLVYINISGSKINIDKDGETSNDCSITVADQKGVNHIITMCVGTSYAQIKE